MSSSSSSFAFQMKSFCTTLEQSSRQLRQQVEGHTGVQHGGNNQTRSADHLLHQAEALSAKVVVLEETILGPAENRLATIKLEEVKRCI
jgi:hypothetical protein